MRACPSFRYTLQASTFQMAVLLQFNEADQWTLTELFESTKIKKDILVQVLQILLKSKLLKLPDTSDGAQDPDNVLLEDSTVFQVSTSITSKGWQHGHGILPVALGQGLRIFADYFLASGVDPILRFKTATRTTRHFFLFVPCTDMTLQWKTFVLIRIWILKICHFVNPLRRLFSHVQLAKQQGKILSFQMRGKTNRQMLCIRGRQKGDENWWKHVRARHLPLWGKSLSNINAKIGFFRRR